MDRMVGVIRTRDLLSAILTDRSLDPRSHLMDAPVIHEHANALKVLRRCANPTCRCTRS